MTKADRNRLSFHIVELNTKMFCIVVNVVDRYWLPSDQRQAQSALSTEGWFQLTNRIKEKHIRDKSDGGYTVNQSRLSKTTTK